MTTPAVAASEPPNPFVSHLEFLGYTLKALDEKERIYSARHPRRTNIILRPFQQGTMFLANFGTKDEAKSRELEMLQLINSFNVRFVTCRGYVDKDKDIAIEAFYATPYDKASFALFIDNFEADITGAISAFFEKAKAILK